MTFFKLAGCLFFWFLIISDSSAVSLLKTKAMIVSANSQGSATAAFSVTGNRVGIHTGAPGTTLDINTGASQDPTKGLRLIGSDGHYFEFHPSLGVGDWNPLTQAGDTGIIYTGGAGLVIAPWYLGAVGMRLDANGNVGIGSSIPTGKLDVTDTYARFVTHTDNLSMQSTSLMPSNYPFMAWFDSSGTRGAYMGWGGTASTGHPYLYLAMENGNALCISGGNVGIGTTSSVYPLDVQKAYTLASNSGSYGYLSPTGTKGTASGAGITYSISALSRIRSAEFNTFSDARIKGHVITANIKEDLQKVCQLRVIEYRYIDTITKGNALKQGLLAQEVEAVMPDVVHKNQEFIPNIFEKATSVHADPTKNQLTVTTLKPHGLKEGDLVRVMGESHQKETTMEKSVITIISDHTFVLNEWKEPVDALFVYGKRVDDFRVIDYAQVFARGISAIQALYQKADSQEKTINEQNKAIHDLTLRLKRLKKTMKETPR